VSHEPNRGGVFLGCWAGDGEQKAIAKGKPYLRLNVSAIAIRTTVSLTTLKRWLPR
jgi:hypothetical protein